MWVGGCGLIKSGQAGRVMEPGGGYPGGGGWAATIKNKPKPAADPKNRATLKNKYYNITYGVSVARCQGHLTSYNIYFKKFTPFRGRTYIQLNTLERLTIAYTRSMHNITEVERGALQLFTPGRVDPAKYADENRRTNPQPPITNHFYQKTKKTLLDH